MKRRISPPGLPPYSRALLRIPGSLITGIIPMRLTASENGPQRLRSAENWPIHITTNREAWKPSHLDFGTREGRGKLCPLFRKNAPNRDSFKMNKKKIRISVVVNDLRIFLYLQIANTKHEYSIHRNNQLLVCTQFWSEDQALLRQ